MQQTRFIVFFLFLSIHSLFAQSPGDLISYEQVKVRSVAEVSDLAVSRGYGLLMQSDTLAAMVNDLLQYPVAYYKVVYSTLDDGEPVHASGLVMIPQGLLASLPLASYQHGTIMPALKNTAPSNYENFKGTRRLKSNMEVNFTGSIMASHGYVVTMPDYLGYGVSADRKIDYTYTPSLATVSRDLLRAARSLCVQENVTLSGEVFLTGWSEGAGATMALHRMLESEHADEFAVVAQSSLAGYYNSSWMISNFGRKERPDFFSPLYLWSAWVLNEHSDALNYSAGEVFRHTYKQLPDQLVSWWMFALRRKTPENLLCEDLYTQLNAGEAQEWYEAAKVNNHYDWKAEAPVYLHHGESDPVLPFFHSQIAQTAMLMQGSEVVLYSDPEGDHWSMVDSYLFRTLADFDALRRTAGSVPVAATD